jgi:hypothetical protein
MGVLGLIVAVTVAWATYAGLFFQTGQQWFESCWTAQNSKRSPTTATESVAWKQCEPVAEGSAYKAGFVFVGTSQITTPMQAVARACPSLWADVPIGGLHLLVVDIVEKAGGPDLVDRFIPPDRMIEEAFLSRWPNCPTVRAASGFPKIVKKGDRWDFEVPCKPCEAEKNASIGSKQGDD